MTAQDLAQPLLRPHAIAIYGASNDPAKNTGRPLRYLEAHGFQGRVYPINPNRDSVQGQRAYKSVAELPEPVDHALILVPRSAVLAAMEDCAAAGVKVVSIFTDGFAEAGAEGLLEQEKVMAVAQQAGMRVIGPNSIGLVNFHTALTLSVNASLESGDLTAGSTAVISQSGSLIGSLISRGAARGMGFSVLVSVGNEADLGVGELVDLLVDEPETKTILLFLEAIADPPVLGRAALRAHAAGKSIVVYKLGRSDVGKDLAVAHTGAVAGSHAAAEAFFRHYGIYRVNMFETLLEMPPLLRYAGGPRGNKVAVVTTTGGGAAMVVDRLGEAGLQIVSPPEPVREAAARHNIELGQSPLIDLTMAGTREGVYQDVLEALLRAPGIDLVLAVVGSSAQFHPELAVSGIVSARKTRRPMAVFLAPEAPVALGLLKDKQLAAFRTPESCADAISTLLRTCPPAPDAAEVCTVIANSPAEHASTSSVTLDEMQSRQFLAARGVGHGRYFMVRPTDTNLPCDLTYPAVAKIVSPDIPHKTEAGVVRVGIENQAQLKQTISELYEAAHRYAPDADVKGVLVEPLITALGEVLVGFRWDVESGPIVVLGMGGVLAELYQDVAIRLAPVSKATALDMIQEVKGLAVINGYRNLPKGDLSTLAETVSQMSMLALESTPTVLEAEINPLMVMEQGKGVAVVDGLVRLQDTDRG